MKKYWEALKKFWNGLSPKIQWVAKCALGALVVVIVLKAACGAAPVDQNKTKEVKCSELLAEMQKTADMAIQAVMKEYKGVIINNTELMDYTIQCKTMQCHDTHIVAECNSKQKAKKYAINEKTGEVSYSTAKTACACKLDIVAITRDLQIIPVKMNPAIECSCD